MTISIIPVNPPGADSLLLWDLYHLAAQSISKMVIRLFSSNPAVVFVTERSNGRSVLPSARVSTILPLYFPSPAMLNPSYEAPS